MDEKEQQELFESYQTFAKSRKRHEADFIEGLKEQFDISKKLENSYKNIVGRLGEQHAIADKAKAAQEALSKKMLENTEKLNSVGVTLANNLIQTNSLQKDILITDQELKNSMDRRIGLQSAIDEKLKEEAEQKSRIQDLSSRIVENEENILNIQLSLKNGAIDEAKAREEISRLQQQNSFFAAEQQISQDALNQSTSEKLALDQRLTAEMQTYNKLAGDRWLQENKMLALVDEKNKAEKEKNKLEKSNDVLAKASSKWKAEELAAMEKIYKLSAQLLFVKMIQMGYERFVQLDKAAEDFRKQTGFSVSQMKELRKDAESLNVQFADMGVSIENVYKAASALTDVFGRTSLVSKEALQNVSLLSANLGVAEEASANVLATFQGLGGATEQAAMNVIKVGAGISEKAGVPFKLVMQDVANASEETLASLGANPSKLMKSAIAARSMGMELNKLVSSQRKLLDFSNSINDEMEASAMLGRNINFQLARQLAFEGRVEDAARATLETVKNAGDFNAMNVYQREALAKAAGMELKDLTKMMAQDAKREAILKGNDEAKKATLKAQEKELENLKKINDLDSEDLVKQNEKALMQQKIQGLMTKLQNALTSMAVSIGSVLEPIITPLVDVIVPAFQGIAFVIGLIGKGLSWILSPIRWIASGISSIASGTGSWSKTIDFIKSQFKDLGTTIGTLIQIAGAGLITTLFFGMGGAGKVMDLVTKPFKAVGSIAKGLVEKIKSPIASAASPDSSKMATDAAKGTVSAAKSSENIKPSAGEGVKKFLQSLAAGLKSMAKADVFIGAANLIPASIGLVAMIPGFFGAKLLSMVNGDAVSDALKGIASGLKKMASKEVALGAASLMLASLSFAVMTVGAIGLAAVAFLGIPAGIGLEALASGIKALGNGKVLFGIAALGLLALAFGGMAYGFKQFADLEWSSLGKAAVAIIGLSLAAAGLAYIAPLIIGGSIALGILGAAIAVFGLGVKVLAETLPSLATSIEQMLTPLTSLGSMSGDLFAAAGGITAIGIALAAFGGGAAAAGIGNFVGGLLGGDPVKKLEKLASVGTQLQTTADSIERISTAMSNFGAVDAFTSAIDKLTLSLSKLNDTVGEMSTIKLAALSVISATGAAVNQTETAPAPAPMDTVGAKLDELIDLMRSGGIAVNLDGRKVSSAMASSGRE